MDTEKKQQLLNEYIEYLNDLKQKMDKDGEEEKKYTPTKEDIDILLRTWHLQDGKVLDPLQSSTWKYPINYLWFPQLGSTALQEQALEFFC